MWFLLLYLQISSIQGVNVALRGSDSPCKGRLEVYHSGQWGLVCHYRWKKENGEVVCKSIGCGNHEYSGIERTRYIDPPLPQQYWMEEVKCTSEEDSLWKCHYVSMNQEQKCDESFGFVAVECSGDVKLSLNLNGQRDECAGVVEFSTSNGIFGVCNSNWDKSKANKICLELDCGDHYNIPKPGMFTVKGQQSDQNVLLNCLGNERYSWQCMEKAVCKERASVICSKHRRYRITGGLQDGSNVCSGLVEVSDVNQNSWKPLQQTDERPEVICSQLNCGFTGNFTHANGTNRLTCSDSVKLNNFTTECFGDVSINVNGADYDVCYNKQYSSQFRENMGKVVCRELGCGDIVRVKEGSDAFKGVLSNVECQGDERSLWHCLAIREEKKCLKTRVICSGSLGVRLRDGLGRCSGRVEVKWEGLWRPIASERNTESSLISEVVCQHLKCGTAFPINRELFIDKEPQQQEFLYGVKCESSSTKLLKCFDNAVLRSSYQSDKSIEIICKKEELKFFEGNSPCKGKVCIEPFDGETRWLLAKPVEENKIIANDTCHAMQCGSLVSFEMEQNATHANVTCSGSNRVEPRVALKNQRGDKCWGTVNICGDEKCGGVCDNTWRANEDSNMICGNLGCGEPIKTQIQLEIENINAAYYSVYCSKKVQNMNMCNFIVNRNPICKPLAQVICTDSVKARLEDPRDKCAGKVSLFFAGDWRPICQDGLDTNLKNAICKELLCGKSKNDDQHDWILQSKGISGIKCGDSANSVSKCDLNSVSLKQCVAGYLKCTDWERLLLYDMEDECSGPVYGLRNQKTHQVSGHGWGEEEGQKLCEYLKCGNYITHSANFTSNIANWWNKTYKCSGKKNIMECESNHQPLQNERLIIKCDSKQPKMVLSSNCTGVVFVGKEQVCASQWDDGMSDKLCSSLNCGKALYSWSTVSDKKDSWHFSCTGMETLLWQCDFKKDSCKNVLSVACKDSIEFSSTEKCGGKLVVKYKGQWEYVCGKLSENDTKKVCDVLKCNDSRELLDEQKIEKDIKVEMKCPAKHYSIFQCFHHLKKEECSQGPAEIKCEGYTPKGDNYLVSLILGLLGGLLVLLVLFLMWTNRKRLLFALRRYRNNNDKDVNPDVNEMDKMDTEDPDLFEGKASFLDDDYEDVDSLVDKSGEEDKDDRKRASSGTEYDDIEGQANGNSPSQTHHDDDLNLPLLPKRPENILDQDTYEVEIEKQEDYDDVIPVEAAANENAEMTGTQAQDVVVDKGGVSDLDEGLVANADAVLVTTEVDVHAQAE